MRNANIIAAILRKRANAGGGGYTPPMDAYSNRAGMYSVARQLVTGATAAIRVRRSSDNAEQDIGFSSGELDQSALTTFVGANDGFITTIYEQGGGTAIAQTTSTAQPRIVISGSVVTSGGKPAADFDGSTDWMDVPDAVLNCGSATTYAVYQADTTTGNHFVFASGGTQKWYSPYHGGTAMRIDIGATTLYNSSSPGADTNIHQMTLWSSSTQAAAYRDGSQLGTTISETATGSTLVTLGGFNESATSAWSGTISEFIIFSVPHNSGGTRAAIEDNQSAFYSTP